MERKKGKSKRKRKFKSELLMNRLPPAGRVGQRQGHPTLVNKQMTLDKPAPAIGDLAATWKWAPEFVAAFFMWKV